MSEGLRTITVLMLIAGVCLGIFASKLLAGHPQRVAAVLDPRIENEVRFWRERYDLDADETDRVRQVLVRMRESSRKALLALKQQNPEPFEAITQEAKSAIEAIVDPREPRGR